MWNINKKSNLPRYQQIIQLVESYVEKGTLTANQKLPSERELSLAMGVNRSTIVRAFDELAERGVLVRKRGSGTFVTADKWGLQNRVVFNWKTEALSKSTKQEEKKYTKKIWVTPYDGSAKSSYTKISSLGSLSSSALPLTEAWTSTSQHSRDSCHPLSKDNVIYNLSYDHLSEEMHPKLSLPDTSWRTLINEEQDLESALLGYSPLRKTIKTFLFEQYGLDAPQEQILITSGMQQAIFLTTQCLLHPGDTVGVESPSYFYSLPVFQATGLRLCPLPMDSEGITLDGLERQILSQRIKMVFLNPIFHNPSGTVMSLARKKQVLEYCESAGVPIFEDDAYSLLAFDPGLNTSPIKCFDTHNRVIYSGSLSSYAGNRLRIGWVVAPESVVNTLAEVRRHMGSGVNILPQTMAKNYLDKDFAQHKLFLWEHLSTRAFALSALLKNNYGDVFDIATPQGGLYLYSQFLEPFSQKGLSQTTQNNLFLKTLARLEKDGFYGINTLRFGDTNKGLRFNFSAYTSV